MLATFFKINYKLYLHIEYRNNRDFVKTLDVQQKRTMYKKLYTNNAISIKIKDLWYSEKAITPTSNFTFPSQSYFLSFLYTGQKLKFPVCLTAGHMTFHPHVQQRIEPNFLIFRNLALSSTEHVDDRPGNVMCPTCWTYRKF